MEFKKCELDLFPTPISVYDLSEVDVVPLLSIINSSKIYEHLLVPNGKSSYGTNSLILDFEELKYLKKIFQECVDDYCSRVSIQRSILSNSWFNITEPGGRLELHRHEGSVVSGAFYPKVDGKLTSLRLKSPLLPYKMNELYNDIDSIYAVKYNEIEPQEGMLILFPSWLEHDTSEEISERIVISFNSFYET
jgi:hypothetical protein